MGDDEIEVEAPISPEEAMRVTRQNATDVKRKEYDALRTEVARLTDMMNSLGPRIDAIEASVTRIASDVMLLESTPGTNIPDPNQMVTDQYGNLINTGNTLANIMELLQHMVLVLNYNPNYTLESDRNIAVSAIASLGLRTQ